jgi:hypothetical protein
MAASTVISLEEYLHSMYRPDCDYVDGNVIERNVGEFAHSLMQGIVMGLLFDIEKNSSYSNSALVANSM